MFKAVQSSLQSISIQDTYITRAPCIQSFHHHLHLLPSSSCQVPLSLACLPGNSRIPKPSNWCWMFKSISSCEKILQKAWVKIKQNQLQLPRKPKYQANTCDLTRRPLHTDSSLIHSDSVLNWRLNRWGSAWDHQAAMPATSWWDPASLCWSSQCLWAGQQPFRLFCKSIIVLHKRKTWKIFFQQSCNCQCPPFFPTPQVWKVLEEIPPSFRPSVSKTLKQSVRIFTWSFSSHADNRGSMRLRNSSNLRQFFEKKHHWESPMIPVPSNLRKCRTSCSSFPFPLLSTLSIAACTSFSVGFIPSRRMHFLYRNVFHVSGWKRLWASQYAAEHPQFRDVNISTLVRIAAIENCLPKRQECK